MRLALFPDPFFSELLPEIDDLNELKVTLHVLWRLGRKRGELPCLSLSALCSDDTLLHGLGAPGISPEEAVRDGLERAVARGSLLQVPAKRKSTAGESEEIFYFVNSEKGRQAVEMIRRGELQLPEAAANVAEPRLPQERPNIFVLYEQNIGLLQPLIAEELRDAERTYPVDWIEDAFREAVRQNKRSWRYVQHILERWAAEGKDDLSRRRDDRRRYIEGKYGEYFKRRQNK